MSSQSNDGPLWKGQSGTVHCCLWQNVGGRIKNLILGKTVWRSEHKARHDAIPVASVVDVIWSLSAEWNLTVWTEMQAHHAVHSRFGTLWFPASSDSRYTWWFSAFEKGSSLLTGKWREPSCGQVKMGEETLQGFQFALQYMLKACITAIYAYVFSMTPKRYSREWHWGPSGHHPSYWISI